MVILIRKRKFGYALCGLALAAALVSLPVGRQETDRPVFSVGNQRAPITVVIDPGHGGEDGGAVSPDGVTESKLNLEISRRLYDLLCFAGQETIMIRTEDTSVHTEGETLRARKVSDIHHRVQIIQEQAPSVFLSIHQNMLPSSPVTRGAQVFWNPQEGAEALAASVQEALNQAINVGNEKHSKPAPSGVYLMKHTAVPGVLVECGFLSNREETEKLQTPSHQLKLAACITAGYLTCGAAEEVS